MTDTPIASEADHVGSVTESPARALSPVPEMDSAETTSSASSTVIETNDKNNGPTEIVFHKDNDMKLVVHGTDKDAIVTVFKVCAGQLSNASEVWRTMIFAQISSHKTDAANDNQHSDLKLAGDAEAIELILRIAHFQFSLVPQQPNLDQLYQLAAYGVQYKCTHLFHPWAEKWLGQFKHFSGEENCAAECHKTLYIAWAFGDIVLFRDMVDRLILTSKLSEKGNLVNVSGTKLSAMLLPEGLLTIILGKRLTTLAKIINVIQVALEDLTGARDGARASYCKVGVNVEGCENMMFGCASRVLFRRGLMPTPKPEAWTGSIFDLLEVLESIVFVPYEGRDYKPHQSHAACNPGLVSGTKALISGMSVHLPSHIIGWLSTQCNTCGIPADGELLALRKRHHKHDHGEHDDETEVEGSDEGADAA
ncbi:hypothetical protein GGR57DRAFT_517152 [Xylariaceae sp. FL1272]|nr:hypothetical protein GGR57DRAFT_517152 [Xylariaceae sp. FL1272]